MIIPKQIYKSMYQSYYDIGTGLAYKNATYLKKHHPKYKKYWDKFLIEQSTYSLTKLPKRKFMRRKYLNIKIKFAFQADLLTLFRINKVNLLKHNNNYKYVLIIKDIVTRMVYLWALKNKRCETVNHIFNKFFSGSKPRQLMTDSGSEFKCKKNVTLFKKRNVKHFYSQNTEIKAGSVENMCRIVRRLIKKYLYHNNTLKWYSNIHKIQSEINNSNSRAIGGIKPIEFTNNSQAVALWDNNIIKFRNTYKKRKKNPKYKVGDTVRVSKLLDTFSKSTDHQFSIEIFKILKVNSTIPITYKLIDLNKVNIDGNFYENELTLTKHRNNIFKISDILGEHPEDKSKVLVRWEGYSDLFNSYIRKKNIIKNYKG